VFRFSDARPAAGKFFLMTLSRPPIGLRRLSNLRQALITAHSSLAGVEKQDVALFKERFLPGTVEAFNKLRRAVDLTIRDIGSEWGCKPMVGAKCRAG
jgi:hypothetical protein